MSAGNIIPGLVRDVIPEQDIFVPQDRLLELLKNWEGYELVPCKRHRKTISLKICKKIDQAKEEILVWPLGISYDECQYAACLALEKLLPENRGKYKPRDAIANLDVFVRLLTEQKLPGTKFQWTYDGPNKHTFILTLPNKEVIKTETGIYAQACETAEEKIEELAALDEQRKAGQKASTVG